MWVETEADRRAIVVAIHYRKGKLGFGAEIKERVAIGAIALMPKDRLSPTPTMPNVASVKDAPLPMLLVFWRPRRDIRGRAVDAVVRRNPIFAADLHTSPHVLAIDTLHTVYLGVAARLVSAILWRVLLSNPWKIQQPNEKTLLELGARRMQADMLLWFETHKAPHGRRVGQLTLPMLGDQRDSAVEGG